MRPVCKINENGTKSWYLNGKLHREDGPAIEWVHRTKSWYLNGKGITEELHTKLTQGSIKNLPLYLESGCDEYIAERLRNE